MMATDEESSIRRAWEGREGKSLHIIMMLCEGRGQYRVFSQGDGRQDLVSYSAADHGQKEVIHPPHAFYDRNKSLFSSPFLYDYNCTHFIPLGTFSFG